jgi:hypothetical protein
VCPPFPFECRSRAVVDVKAPDAVRLGCLATRPASVLGQRPGDRHQAVVERDVAPPQAEQLAATHAGTESRCPEARVDVIADPSQKAARLVGGPDLDGRRCVAAEIVPGEGDAVGGVRLEEIQSHGVVERLVQHRVDVAQRPERQRPAAAPAVVEQVAVQLLAAGSSFSSSTSASVGAR